MKINDTINYIGNWQIINPFYEKFGVYRKDEERYFCKFCGYISMGPSYMCNKCGTDMRGTNNENGN